MTQVIVKDAAIRAELEAIADEWRAQFPADYEEFLRIIDQESKNVKLPTAMSTEGNYLNYCKIPQLLHDFILYRFRKRHGVPDFFRDAKNYRLLAEVWPASRIRRKPTKTFLNGRHPPHTDAR